MKNFIFYMGGNFKFYCLQLEYSVGISKDFVFPNWDEIDSKLRGVTSWQSTSLRISVWILDKKCKSKNDVLIFCKVLAGILLAP